MPKWNSEHDYSQLAAPKHKNIELCIRETRWTDEILTKLHNDLKGMQLYYHVYIYKHTQQKLKVSKRL